MSPALDVLPDALARNRADERRRALRALLLRPLLDAGDPAFPLVRRHAGPLREWLAKETGWWLQVEGDFARLHKTPADHRDGTRRAGVGGATAMPFTRRRYALLCLLLADLERGEGQVTLGRFGEALMQAAADPALEAAGLRFTLESRDQRRDLVAVVRLLLSYGVLARVAGDEDAFVQRGRDSDVLYDVHRRLLAALLVTARGPSLVELDGAPENPAGRLAAIGETFVPDTPEARNRELRHRLTSRLLDDPVLYYDELDDAEHAYLQSQRAAIARRIEEATGLVAEVRAEGMAMVDPHGELSDEQMPAEGTDGHVTLLLAEHLAAAGTGESLAALAARVRDWVRRYGRYWRRAAREPGAEHELCRQAVARLEALRLARRDGDRVEPLPALARFAVHEPTVSGTGMEDAFGD